MFLLHLIQRLTINTVMTTKMSLHTRPRPSEWKRYLIYFAGEHVDFQVSEIKSIARIFNMSVKMEEPIQDSNQNPFLILHLMCEEDARLLMTRSVLSKSIFELWCEAESYTEICKCLASLPSELVESYEAVDDVKMTICSHGKRVNGKVGVEIIDELLKTIPLTGKINLTYPMHTFTLLMYFSKKSFSIDEADKVYFGRWICNGCRELVYKYNLKDRYFIGNTSMDPCLAFVMTNLAQVQPGHIVFDPFCGTGSILVSAAHWKAYVLGADIDFPLLHATSKPSRPNQKKRGEDESIRSNLRQYGLGDYYLDVMILDAAHCMLRAGSLELDTIITDPPYGVRERSIKVGTEKKEAGTRDMSMIHYPEKLEYGLKEMLSDLFTFATHYLKLSGHLVFWLPVNRETYHSGFIPSHPCFHLVANCEQVLNSHTSRRLITMQKHRDIQELRPDESTSLMVDDYVSDFRKLYFQPKIPAQS